ncbi:hypothetical protein E2C01_010371 [Portunus trituberculatus]|uniref:Uncharacterized protein n=1 Tax=Portunus trituberculatus TaxID=210409 RepID=A0A5B7D8I0_PORTR|nr:hypothetical protein [Portunus trituberculatus]
MLGTALAVLVFVEKRIIASLGLRHQVTEAASVTTEEGITTRGLTVVGTFMPTFLPGWPVENIALWLSLAEGLLLPPVLGLVDATFSEAAGSSCCKNKQQPHKYNVILV